ncbi:META domain-containing protein [Pseudoalteromonas sp. SSDWG2]|uniref:META domain-containing protein n=1 Tax=Pseudoalteromonas sp. SSDWG2 TaxID=3139391 RepID=UPI003BADBD51
MIIKWVSALLICILIAGCASTEQRLANEMKFQRWQLVMIDSQPINTTAYIRFIDAMQLEGHSGCNDFFASTEVVESTLLVSNVGMTYKLCAQQQGQTEQVLLDTLKSTPSLSVSGVSLTLTGSHTLTFAAQAN